MMRMERILNLWWVSLLAGSVIWLVELRRFLGIPTFFGQLNLLLLLAALIVTPLALRLLAQPDPDGRHSRWYVLAVALQPIAALLLVASLSRPSGLLAGVLAVGWLLLTVLVALYGLSRLRQRGLAPIAETCLDFALLYLPIGGFWTVLARLGVPFLQFDQLIVHLTAEHFHYIPLGGLLLTGLVGRKLPPTARVARRVYQFLAVSVIVGPMVVALGITFSRPLETAGALWLTVSLMLVGVLTLTHIVATMSNRLAQMLLVVSSLSMLMTMLLATGYALRGIVPGVTLSIPGMIQAHGWVNALGFTLLGLLAWLLTPSATRRNPQPVAVDHLSSSDTVDAA